jgi:hypothetical protein
MGRRTIIPLLFVILAMFTPALMAAKTDIVYLKNGDRITGEVKNLLRGKLELSTDHMGTISIDWEDIREVVSDVGQVVELSNGQRFFGPLQKPEESEMVIIKTEEGPVGLDSLDVVAMYPAHSGFWQRLDFSGSLGFTWDKSSNVGKYSLNLDANYRRPESITNAGLVMELTTQEGRDETTRAVADANHIMFHRNKRFRMVFGNLEHNDELGIELRSLLGAGTGWVPFRTQHHWLTIGGGLDVNREIPVSGDPQTNLEAVLMTNYEYYKYDVPERQFQANLMVFPSITDSGRIRASFDTSYTIEFVKDFFWKLSLYASYDNRPISEKASTSDYGITSSLGYKF